jgi:hypothetical protein
MRDISLLAIANGIAHMRLARIFKLLTPHRNIIHKTLIETYILAQDNQIGDEVDIAIAIAARHGHS